MRKFIAITIMCSLSLIGCHLKEDFVEKPWTSNLFFSSALMGGEACFGEFREILLAVKIDLWHALTKHWLVYTLCQHKPFIKYEIVFQ